MTHFKAGQGDFENAAKAFAGAAAKAQITGWSASRHCGGGFMSSKNGNYEIVGETRGGFSLMAGGKYVVENAKVEVVLKTAQDMIAADEARAKANEEAAAKAAASKKAKKSADKESL